MRTLVATLLTTLSTLAYPQAALELKGLRLGMAERETVERFASIQCRDAETRHADRICLVMATSTPELATLAEQPVKYWSLSFKGERLGLITASLVSDHYDAIAEALEAKYGKPTARREPTLQNRMGARFANTTVEWRRGDEVLTAERYGGDVDSMRVILASRTLVMAPKDGAGAQKRAKDL